MKIVYARLSLGMILLGMILIPFMFPVAFYETQGPALAGVAFAVVVPVLLFIAVKSLRYAVDGRRLSEFAKALATEPVSVQPGNRPCILMLCGLVFTLGGYLPLRPFIEHVEPEGDMGTLGRLLFSAIFCLLGLGLLNYGIASLFLRSAFDADSWENDNDVAEQ